MKQNDLMHRVFHSENCLLFISLYKQSIVAFRSINFNLSPEIYQEKKRCQHSEKKNIKKQPNDVLIFPFYLFLKHCICEKQSDS